MSERPAEYEYIVVGSGAGGGTLAARLAEAGHKVLLLEAGGDPRELRGGVRWDPARDSLPNDYDVPVFHATFGMSRDHSHTAGNSGRRSLLRISLMMNAAPGSSSASPSTSGSDWSRR